MADSLWRRVLFPGHHPAGPDIPRVLVLTVSIVDQVFYRNLRARGEWDMVLTHSVPEALLLLAREAFPIVLCDRELPGWDWRQVMAKIVESSPRICFLLTSRVSDEYLWREVAMHGGYDVVAKPLEQDAVERILRRAWYYWKAEPTPGTSSA
jgi:DNA-binding NtrC family response regulator